MKGPDHGRHLWGEECRPGYGLYLIQLGHALRLPAGERHAVEILQNIPGHLLIVVLDLGLFIEQSRGTVPHGMEQIGPCSITPQQIKQIPGVTGLVWALHDKQAG